MSEYNEDLRSELAQPAQYDRMIVLLMQHHPEIDDQDEACKAINFCIRACLQEREQGGVFDYFSKDMCVAYMFQGIRLALQPTDAGENLALQADKIRRQHQQLLLY